MSLILGNTPERLDVILVRDAPFVVQINATAGGVPVSWPLGTSVRLQVGGTVWIGTLSPGAIVFAQSAAEVNAVLDASDKSAELFIMRSDTRIPWARGRVVAR